MKRHGNGPSGTTAAEDRPLFNRLPVLRAERGLSRQDLATAVGVNYQTVGYLERGEYNPSLELAFRLSELFRVPIELIFSRQPPVPLSEAFAGRSPGSMGKEPNDAEPVELHHSSA